MEEPCQAPDEDRQEWFTHGPERTQDESAGDRGKLANSEQGRHLQSRFGEAGIPGPQDDVNLWNCKVHLRRYEQRQIILVRSGYPCEHKDWSKLRAAAIREGKSRQDNVTACCHG